MQIYIVGIGQCGTSIAFDVISRLTGFVKSKTVTSSPQTGGTKAASNELLKRLKHDLGIRERWKEHVLFWYNRLMGGNNSRKVFVMPRIAIIDGNPDNFIKDAFDQFRGGVAAADDSSGDKDDNVLRQQLVDLITGTEVLGLGDWKNGCANGIVGETITSTKHEKTRLRDNLRIDGAGKQMDHGNLALPVNVYLVVSSAGGGTGSGGGVYLGQGDALADRGRNKPLVLNAVVLPSVQSSMDNPRYALNAGRAMARYANVIAMKDGEGNRNSSAVLFSNPGDEGDNRTLQALNNYVAEFSIRLANFTFLGNVARIARDVDPRELATFFTDKVSALGMSYLSHDDWDNKDNDIEKLMVERAFGDIYKNIGETPQGLSLEKTIKVGGSDESVLKGTTSAIMVVGLPPDFSGKLDLNKIGEYVRDFSESESRLSAGIRTFSYGSAKDLEFTVFLRYRHLDACPLAQYFVGRYVDPELGTGGVTEIQYLEKRAAQDDGYAEVFEEVVRDLKDLGGLDTFDRYVLNDPQRKTVRRDVVEGEAP